MKILLIRFSSIGDIVLASPAIRCAKLQIPCVQIHFLTKSSMKAVVENNPYIDQFHFFSGSLKNTIQELKKENFDYIIDLHKNLRSFRIRFSLDVPTLSFRKLSLEKFLLTKFGINKMPNRHISLRSVDALKPLGVNYDGNGLDYFVSKINEENFSKKFNHLPNKYVALVLGASYETKRMPVNLWLNWIDQIPMPIILLGGSDCENENLLIQKARPEKVISLVGKCSLDESALVLKNAQLVASHDTGLLYMACAFNVPTVAVWGGTSPKLQVEPFYPSSNNNPKYYNSIVEGLNCQPCSNFGTKSCPKGHFKCMNNQNIHQLVINSLALLD